MMMQSCREEGKNEWFLDKLCSSENDNVCESIPCECNGVKSWGVSGFGKVAVKLVVWFHPPHIHSAT